MNPPTVVALENLPGTRPHPEILANQLAESRRIAPHLQASRRHPRANTIGRNADRCLMMRRRFLINPQQVAGITKQNLGTVKKSCGIAKSLGFEQIPS
jgi:hypothetical protein